MRRIRPAILVCVAFLWSIAFGCGYVACLDLCEVSGLNDSRSVESEKGKGGNWRKARALSTTKKESRRRNVT